MSIFIDNHVKNFIERIRFMHFPDISMMHSAQEVDQIGDWIFSMDMIFFEQFKQEGHNEDMDMVMNIHYSHFNDAPPHKHDYFEMIFVYNGKCINNICSDTKTSIEMHKGNICLLNPNTPHSIHIDKDGKDVVFNIMFKKHLFETSLMSLISDNDLIANFLINSLYNVSESQDYLLFHFSEETYNIIVNIVTEFFKREPCYLNSAKAYLVILFSLLIRQFDSAGEGIENFSNVKIDKILNYISDNYSNTNLKKTADYFYYNPSYLSTYIKKSTGRTFSDILDRLKLEHVCKYLKTTDMPINKILEKTGINYGSHFFNHFKETMSMTPSEYRNKHKNK